MQIDYNKLMKSDVALYAMFVSITLVLSYVESLIPYFFPVPGIKLGLANIVILWVLYCMDIKSAILVSFARILLNTLLFGNLYSFAFSAVGGALSLATMFLLKKTTKLKIVTISIVGAVMHNVGQIIVAIVVMKNIAMTFYLPVLLASGIISGLAVGILGGFLCKKINLLQTSVRE